VACALTAVSLTNLEQIRTEEQEEEEEVRMKQEESRMQSKTGIVRGRTCPIGATDPNAQTGGHDARGSHQYHSSGDAVLLSQKSLGADCCCH